MEEAIELIQNARLEHPSTPLLETFLDEAADRQQAARFLVGRCSRDPDGVEMVRFIEDWKTLVRLFMVEHHPTDPPERKLRERIMKRDDKKCCLTGQRSQLFERLRVVPVLPIDDFNLKKGSLFDMLIAFVGPDQANKLLSWDKTDLESKCRNHWLLSREAADVYAQGSIRLEKLEDALYSVSYNAIGGPIPPIYLARSSMRWKCHLIDFSESDIDTPDPDLVQLHFRLSKAMKWTKIADSISERKRSPKLSSSQNHSRSAFSWSLKIITLTFLAIWMLIPTQIRIYIYQKLSHIGTYLYGGTISFNVQKLPFGLYLKTGPTTLYAKSEGEFGALQLVRRYTSIPVPRPIDLIQTPKFSFLLTSRVEGERIGIGFDFLSDDELARIATALRNYIAQLRTIPPIHSPDLAICNSIGKACHDYRIYTQQVGPCVNEQTFNEVIFLTSRPQLAHRTDHRIYFTHGDLNMGNILMDNGAVTGIVDWENAGWYPEYWEYTKCHFSVKRGKPRWSKFIDDVFKEDDYSDELKIERQLWALEEW